jgi:hypothetical protein
MKRRILPARKLRLRIGYQLKTYIGSLLSLAVAVALGFGASCTVRSAGTILRDKEVWEHGIASDGGTLHGKRNSHIGLTWLYAQYRGDVSYSDETGQRFEGSFSFDTMLGGPDIDDAAELRYDRDHHDRFAVSWAVEASGARWRAVVVMTLLLGVLAVTFAFLAWVLVADLHAERRMVATADEVELRVKACTPITKEGKPTGKWHHQLELVDDTGTTIRELAVTSAWLLYCASDNARVFGLWRPGHPKRVIVLDRDCAPLAVTAAEREAIMQRAEA